MHSLIYLLKFCYNKTNLFQKLKQVVPFFKIRYFNYQSIFLGKVAKEELYLKTTRLIQRIL